MMTMSSNDKYGWKITPYARIEGLTVEQFAANVQALYRVMGPTYGVCYLWVCDVALSLGMDLYTCKEYLELARQAGLLRLRGGLEICDFTSSEWRKYHASIVRFTEYGPATYWVQF